MIYSLDAQILLLNLDRLAVFQAQWLVLRL